jgi:hypothetical protein
MTHQEAWDVVALAWHDVDYEQFFFLNFSKLHTLQYIKMIDKSLVRKPKKIT